MAEASGKVPQQEARAIAWCDRCRAVRDVEGGKEFIATNGARQRKGTCVACGSALTGQLEGPAGNYG